MVWITTPPAYNAPAASTNRLAMIVKPLNAYRDRRSNRRSRNSGIV
ncbi:hypothetical protein BH23ACT10_BH23ACT10_25840 [soil metagenome]